MLLYYPRYTCCASLSTCMLQKTFQASIGSSLTKKGISTFLNEKHYTTQHVYSSLINCGIHLPLIICTEMKLVAMEFWCDDRQRKHLHLTKESTNQSLCSIAQKTYLIAIYKLALVVCNYMPIAEGLPAFYIWNTEFLYWKKDNEYPMLIWKKYRCKISWSICNPLAQRVWTIDSLPGTNKSVGSSCIFRAPWYHKLEPLN